MKELFGLFFSFAKIGLFTFGGGYAMLPMLQKEIVENKKWATEDELMDYFAIGQCTPGVIAVNTATFIGHKRKGISGGIFATLGVVFPSVIIITIIAAFLKNFADYPIVRHAFGGIRVCVCVLIANAVIKLGKKALAGTLSYIIFGIVLLLALWGQIQTAFLVLAAGVSGIVLYLIKKKKPTKSVPEAENEEEKSDE